MTNIYLIRHGETDWNKLLKVQGRTNRPLNETGIKQAHENSVFLEDIKFDAVVSSPLDRAFNTATIFKQNNKWDIDIEINELVTERSFGVLEGSHVEEFREITDFTQYEGYETDEEIISRLKQAINDYSTKDYENVAIFAHSHILKAAVIAYLEEMTFTEFFLPNCAIMKLSIQDGSVVDTQFINCELNKFESQL